MLGVIERELDKTLFVSISDRRASMLTALIIAWKRPSMTQVPAGQWTVLRGTARSLHHGSVTH